MNKYRLGLAFLLCLCLTVSSAWASNPQAIAQTHTGLANVAKGTLVQLDGLAWTDSGAIVSYAWTLTGPAGSTAHLDSAASMNVTFVPDLIGHYTVTLTSTDEHSATSPVNTLNLNVSTWLGEGLVGGTSNCGCHSSTVTSWGETRHSNMLHWQIDGGDDPSTSHYSGSCISCHTVGYNTLPTAVNGGFDDLMTADGWTFPAAPLAAGNWDALVSSHPDLAALGNIQCENCHGPAANHRGDVSKIAVSLDADMCGVCHNKPNNHVKNTEWAAGTHSTSNGEGASMPQALNRKQCAHCHTAQGFMETVIGGADSANGAPYPIANAVTCQVCHSSHGNSGEYQIRTTDATSICDNCHRLRISSRGLHHSHQSNVLDKNSGYEYPGHTYAANPHAMVAGRCIDCHMQPGPAGSDTLNPARFKMGGHTFKVRYDGGTPGDESDDSLVTSGCTCHPGTTTFNIGGTQEEITALLDTLGWLIDPVAGTTIPQLSRVDTSTAAGVSKYHAVYNYTFVSYDGSRGVHNPPYTKALLRDAIADMRATFVDGGRFNPSAFYVRLVSGNPITTLARLNYAIPRSGLAKVEVLRTDGSSVATLVDGQVATGVHPLEWTPSGSGVYIVRLSVGDNTTTQRVVVTK